MYCKECGTAYENENGEYCLSCGVKKENGNKFCQDCGAEKKNENQAICLSCGVEFEYDNEAELEKNEANVEESEKTRLVALLLGLFLGGFGAHQYYVGNAKKGTIILVLSLAGCITFGITSIVACIMIWVDLFHIIAGTFTDSENKKLIKWS